MNTFALRGFSRGHLTLVSLSALVIVAALLLLLDGSPGDKERSPSGGIGSQGGELIANGTSPSPGSNGSSFPGGLPRNVPSPRPDGSPDPDANKAHGELKFEVKLIPECASQGLPMRAEISTTPGAAITLAVVYKDGQTYGQFGTFRANDNGQLIYPWTVPSSVPNGLGRFLAGADDQSLGTSSAGYWNFRIERPGRC